MNGIERQEIIMTVGKLLIICIVLGLIIVGGAMCDA